MAILLNPGSRIGGLPEGVRNTYADALAEARRWLAQIREDGIADVELIEHPEQAPRDGRWTFDFRHAVTGVVCSLETHGLDDVDAYEAARIFTPRIYWRGSSCSSPSLDDWAAPGFVQTFRPTTQGA
jgi:hypothetical protein